MSNFIGSTVFSFASVTDKGRGGGGSITVDDNWDAPGLIKANMAFEIIWSIAALVQLIYVFKNLSKVPSGSRGPYILLAVVAFATFLYYLIWAIWTRIAYADDRDLSSSIPNKISVCITACFTIVAPFLSAVVLWILQSRGAVLRASKNSTISPLSSLLWKRIVDWVLVGITFILYIASMGNFAAFVTAVETSYVSSAAYQRYSKTSQGLSHTILAFLLLLCIDIVATSITLFVQAKRAQWTDPIIRRFCFIMVPLQIVYGLQWMIFDIYYSTAKITQSETIYGANLAQQIIKGLFIMLITGVIILTMTMPGVVWATAGGVLPSYPTTSGQWPPSNPEEKQQQQQPFYPQQPYYQQQQPYYNQQQPYFAQQPPQQQSPYSVPSNMSQHQQSPYTVPNNVPQH